MALLELCNLTRRFGGLIAVDDVSLAIESGGVRHPAWAYALGATVEFMTPREIVAQYSVHDTLCGGDAATECLALMVQDAMHGAGRDQLLQQRVIPLITQHPEFEFRTTTARGNPSGYVVETLHVVFQAFFGTTGFRECLVDVVNRGGDADTTGAIAGMLAGALYGQEALPKTWLRALDTHIRQACETQARALVGLVMK